MTDNIGDPVPPQRLNRYQKCNNEQVKRSISNADTPSSKASQGGLTSTAKRVGEDRFFSGAFVVTSCISAIFRLICSVILRFSVYLQSDKLVCVTAIASYKAKHLNTMSIKGIVGYGKR